MLCLCDGCSASQPNDPSNRYGNRCCTRDSSKRDLAKRIVGRTLAITRLARETLQSEIRHRRQLGVHCIVSICVLLRFCHAQFRSAFVEHLLHAQLRPSSTFMRLSGYDTSLPMARALRMQNRSWFRSLQRCSTNADNQSSIWPVM